MATKLTLRQRAELIWIQANLVDPAYGNRSLNRRKIYDYLLANALIFRHADGFYYLTDAGRAVLSADTERTEREP